MHEGDKTTLLHFNGFWKLIRESSRQINWFSYPWTPCGTWVSLYGPPNIKLPVCTWAGLVLIEVLLVRPLNKAIVDFVWSSKRQIKVSSTPQRTNLLNSYAVSLKSQIDCMQWVCMLKAKDMKPYVKVEYLILKEMAIVSHATPCTSKYTNSCVARKEVLK